MSQGLPVLGSPYGSLPELITEETGFIVHSYEELAEKLKHPGKTFDPLVIRKDVEENFSIRLHTERYLVLYEKIKGGAELNLKGPSYLLTQRAEELLPF